MKDQTELCNLCRKPKRSDTSASITQWISTCVCSLSSEEQNSKQLEVCLSCGKRIGKARAGSLTQFIFQPDYCGCERPKASSVQRKHDFYLAPEGLEEESFETEDILGVDPTKFPLERYKPFRVLGEGASGIVYLCHDTVLAKNVALKVLHNLQPSQLVAFQEEAKSTSRLEHPSIIQILDFGLTDSQAPYMVLESFGGQALSSLLEKESSLKWQLALSIAMELSSALSYSNSIGIFHRDVKPSNILVQISSTGLPTVKVIDFGVARFGQVEDGGIAGTPAYMCPEQSSGANYDMRSEIYSLGVVLFELLTGEKPFSGETSLEQIAAHSLKPTPRVSDLIEIDDQIDQVVFKAMSKAPEDRFENFDQFRAALESCYQIEPISPDDHEDAPPRQFGLTKGGIGFVFVASLLTISICGAIVYILNHGRTEPKSETKLPKTVMRADDLFFINKGKKNIQVNSRTAFTDQDLALLRRELDSDKPIVLELSKEKFTGEGLKYLKSLPIIFLNLQFCDLAPKAGLYVKDLRQLKTLDLRSSGITDEFFVNLGRHKAIEKLDLGGNHLTDKCLLYIATWPRLKYLILNGTEVTNIGLGYLAKQPSLRSISLSHNVNVTGEGIEKLASLPLVDFIDAGYSTNMDASYLKALSKLPRLHNVHIGGQVKFKPEDLLILQESKSLRKLVLVDLRPISKYLPYVAKLKRIRRLHINDSDLNDRDIPYLIAKKNLIWLNLSAVPKLSKKGIAKLARRLPKRCEFITDDSDISEQFGSVKDWMFLGQE